MEQELWLKKPHETTVHSNVMVVKSKNLRATGSLPSSQSQFVNVR